ncbi:MAG: germination protein YpeB [Peptococcaceae bacterium]|jgi:spore germination protein|nr:germination protein YpeB [Peptococcaceae bacterium]
MRNKMIVVLSVALLAALGWGFYEYHWTGKYRLAIENQNKRAMNDLAGYLDSMETTLAKSRAGSSDRQRVFYLSRLAAQSGAAAANYAQLPAENTGLSYVGQFVAQVGDMSRHLTYKIAAGEALTAEEEDTLTAVHQRLIAVNQTIQELLVRIHTEELVWTTPGPTLSQRLFGRQVALASAEGEEGVAVSVRNGLEQLDANLQKLPPFSYTGDYATHAVSEPLGLPPVEVTSEQAAAKAGSFLEKMGLSAANLEYAGESQGEIPCYIFRQGTAYLEITQRGGMVRFFQDERPKGVRTLTAADAKAKVLSVLPELGWQDMVITATIDNGADLQVEAVSEIGGIRYYADKVVVRVALDQGQVVGIDATAYWAYHHERALPEARLSASDARKRLKADVQVEESRLAVIAKQGNEEVLCYEFRGRYGPEEYVIYLNAENGTEEEIKRVIMTPRGEFMQ